MSKVRALRCAIYTRKSTEDGLDQTFNSLDAQREACSAYIVSQSGLGWRELPALYDDDGVSGGTMDRPALARLLLDIEAGKVDVIVVYKIDRLTRSLADFARMVEVFERHDVAFVSITQQFNTTSSMGRLTLNVLLSFAQFEREVTAERIRDKIAASRRKDLWMGGSVPFGYKLIDHALVPDEPAAATVRLVFERYLALRSVRLLAEELSSDPPPGLKALVARGRLYHMLANPVYIGKVRHKSDIYEGVHDAIVDKALFDEAQCVLAQQTSRGSRTPSGEGLHLLSGLVFDETGDRLSPTHANKKGRHFGYYTSSRLATKRRQPADQTAWRIPAAELEHHVETELKRLLTDHRFLMDMLTASHGPDVDPSTCERLVERASATASTYADANLPTRKQLIRAAFSRISIKPGVLRYTIDGSSLSTHLLGNDLAATDRTVAHIEPITLERPFKLRRRGVETKIIIAGKDTPALKPDAALIDLVTRAHCFLADLTDGSGSTIAGVAKQRGVPASEVSRILPLAFLAPSITQAILDGTQPVDLIVDGLARIRHLPLDWQDQSKIITL